MMGFNFPNSDVNAHLHDVYIILRASLAGKPGVGQGLNSPSYSCSCSILYPKLIMLLYLASGFHNKIHPCF